MSMQTQALWPVEEPPVDTIKWCQADWDRYNNRFRPADYTGGLYDFAAWTAYRANKLKEPKQ